MDTAQDPLRQWLETVDEPHRSAMHDLIAGNLLVQWLNREISYLTHQQPRSRYRETLNMLTQYTNAWTEIDTAYLVLDALRWGLTPPGLPGWLDEAHRALQILDEWEYRHFLEQDQWHHQYNQSCPWC